MLQLMDTYCGGWAILIIGLFESIAIGWIYGKIKERLYDKNISNHSYCRVTYDSGATCIVIMAPGGQLVLATRGRFLVRFQYRPTLGPNQRNVLCFMHRRAEVHID